MASSSRTVTLRGSAYPVVLPSIRDPRLHVAAVIISIHVLGQLGLNFQVSVPQILAAILAAALLEVAITFAQTRALVWPASAMLTGSGVALILRVVGTSADDPLVQHPDKLKAAPGTRAPHVVLERDGASISTLDLFGEHFVLLTGPKGGAWRAAAEEAASALGVPIDVWQVGGERSLRDVTGRFLEAYALEPAGAVLVRPDSFVAWRESDSASADGRALGRALAAILSRRTA